MAEGGHQVVHQPSLAERGGERLLVHEQGVRVPRRRLAGGPVQPKHHIADIRRMAEIGCAERRDLGRGDSLDQQQPGTGPRGSLLHGRPDGGLGTGDAVLELFRWQQVQTVQHRRQDQPVAQLQDRHVRRQRVDEMDIVGKSHLDRRLEAAGGGRRRQHRPQRLDRAPAQEQDRQRLAVPRRRRPVQSLRQDRHECVLDGVDAERPVGVASVGASQSLRDGGRLILIGRHEDSVLHITPDDPVHQLRQTFRHGQPRIPAQVFGHGRCRSLRRPEEAEQRHHVAIQQPAAPEDGVPAEDQVVRYFHRHQVAAEHQFRVVADRAVCHGLRHSTGLSVSGISEIERFKQHFLLSPGCNLMEHCFNFY